MKKQMLFAAVAGMTLVSAHPGPNYTSASGPIEAKTGYPPCSRTVTDRCIQLNERAARAPANLARNNAPAAAPLPARVRAPASAQADDIDVSYAGEVLQAPRAGHHPGAAPDVRALRIRPGIPAPDAHAMRHRPDMDGPTRVVVIREQRRAHALPMEAVAAHAAAHPAMPVVAPAARPAVRTAALARPVLHQPPRRQYSMQVRRAGERG